jgi:prevent-host-death family protein
MSTLLISVPLAEAKSKLSELVERVSRGEEFIITRHDTEIARLVPVRRPSRMDVVDAIASMRAGRAGRRGTVAELREWKLEGRR